MNHPHQTDLWSEAIFYQGQYIIKFKVPWKKAQYIRTKEGELIRFTNKAEAAQKGADFVYSLLADNTTGFFKPSRRANHEEIKLVFGDWNESH